MKKSFNFNKQPENQMFEGIECHYNTITDSVSESDQRWRQKRASEKRRRRKIAKLYVILNKKKKKKINQEKKPTPEINPIYYFVMQKFQWNE